jgi:hypothetical protein
MEFSFFDIARNIGIFQTGKMGLENGFERFIVLCQNRFELKFLSFGFDDRHLFGHDYLIVCALGGNRRSLFCYGLFHSFYFSPARVF